MRKAAFSLALLLLLFASHLTMPMALRAQSQAGTGQIVGTVFDSTGAAVPGAAVTVANKDTGLTREVESNEAGQYRFILLPPGRYTVTAKKVGFKLFKTEVEVTVGATPTVDATLTVGEVTQVVEVTATALIESTAPQSDALINTRSIAELPINGRRFHDFVTLTPTVQIEPQRNGISFAGQRGINSNITIDGADYNEPFFGGIRGGERANNAFTIPQEAVSQFQIVSYGYSVEFGRSSGGIMNATTKSGTNNLHGSGFYYVRRSDFAKEDAFARPVLDSLDQVGGSLGGAIRQDKLFFFGAAEYQKSDNPRVVVFRRLDLFTPAAAQMEAACFYRAFTGCTSGSGLEEDFNQTNNAVTFLGRVDQQFNAAHRLAVRYHYSRNTGENAVSTGDAIFPETNRAQSNNGTEGDRTHTATGQWTAVFSPRLVMETRGQYSREERPRTANAQLTGISNTIGTTGTRDFLPTTLEDWRAQVASNLTWTRGRHTVKFGGEFNHMFADQFFKFNQFGVFSMGASGSGFTPINTLLNVMSVGSSGANDPVHRLDTIGAPTGTSVTYRVNIGNGLLQASMRELAFFVQDVWRVTPRFTVTAGFRWEGYFNPEPDVSNSALYNQVKSFAFPLGLTTDPAIIPDNLEQYMPRVGIAWDPKGDSKTVIRANAGLFYARSPLLLFAAPLNNFRTPAGDLSVQLPLSLPTGYVCTPLASGDNCNTVYWQMRRIGIDLDTINLSALPALTPTQILDIATALGLTVDPNRNAAPITWANNYKAPRSWQWGVGMEREIRRGWSLGADFVYVNTVYLQRNRDYNLPPPILYAGDAVHSADLSLRPCFGVTSGSVCTPTSPSPAVPTRARPIATLSSVQVRESNGRALYRGLTVRSVYRRSRYQFQAYYTLSKNFTDDDNERSAGGQDAVNAFNLREEYGYSRLDARHLFLLNSVVDLPGGFTVSGLTRLRSARPIDPTTGSDTNGDNFFNDRAFQTPGVPFPRNSFRDLRVYNVDLRVAKKFNLPREGMRIDITADFFNLFNFDNITYTSGASSGRNRDYGLGISSTTGLAVPPNVTFRRLKDPSFCSRNAECYDTSNAPGLPLLVQFGMRFQF